MKKLLPAVIIIVAFLCTAQRSGAVTCPAGISYGETIDCSIDAAGETDSYTFAGASGERVLVRMADASGPLSPKIVIKRPNGTQICSTATGSTQAEINACALDASGAFTISASDSQGTGTGNYYLTLLRTNNPVNATSIVYGEALSGSLANPAAYDAYTFTGATGEKVIVRAVDTSGSDFYLRIRIYRPDGSYSSCSSYGTTLAEINTCELTSDGTYTILVGDYDGTHAGSYDLYLLRTNYPPTTTPIAYGQTLSGNLTNPLAYDAYAFTGATGERIIVRAVDTSGSDFFLRIRIYRPDGSASSCYSYGTTLAEINTCELTSDGTYTILVGDYYGTNTGSYDLYLLRTNYPPTTTPIAYGQTLSGNLTNPLAYDAYTFTGATGEKVIVRAVDTSGSDFFLRIRIYRPDGSASSCYSYGTTLAEINTCELTSDGTYTILVGDYYGTNTGSYDLYLLRTNYPPTTTPIAYGQTLSGNLTNPLAYDAYTFTGATGEKVIVRAVDTSGSAFYPLIRIYKPDGSYASCWSYGTTLAEINTCQLASDGTYTILVGDYYGTHTGSYDLYLARTNNPVNATPLTDGQIVSGAVTVPVAYDAYTFVGNASDGISVTVTDTSGGPLYPRVRVYRPDGSQLCSDYDSTEARANCILDVSGSHAIFVGDSNGTSTGTYDVRLQMEPPPSNDNFPGEVVSSTPFSAIVSNIGATLETDEPRPCGSIGATVWYSITPSSNSSIVVDTAGSDFDTALAVYTGSALSSLTNIGCDYHSAKVQFIAAAGTTYYIQAGGYASDWGTLSVSIDLNTDLTGTVGVIDSPVLAYGGTLPEVPGYELQNLPVASVNSATLASLPTVVLNMTSIDCASSTLSPSQKTALVSYVEAGGKLIIYDSECVPPVDYSWLPYGFMTDNPGAQGARVDPDDFVIVEENSLSSSDPSSQYYIDTADVATSTDAIGDANIMLTTDGNWCGDMLGENVLGDRGIFHAYSSHGLGLFIYNGIDADDINDNDWLAKIWRLEVAQPSNPSGLPCSSPVEDARLPVFDPTHPASNPDYPVPWPGEPVNAATGDFAHSHTDLAIPGRGVPLEFTRYYHLGSDSARSLGYGWTHTYDTYLTFESSTIINLFYAEGYANRFVLTDGVYEPRTGIHDKLVKNEDDTYTLTTRNQISYNYSASGRLTSISDRNGNTTTVSYDGSGRLASVTDSSGRSLTFTVNSSGRITQITDSSVSPARTVGFQYSGTDLITVTDVKGGQAHFTYSNHRMLTIADSLGHTQTTNILDVAGRVAEQTDTRGGVTCFYYGSGTAYTSDACPGITPGPTTHQTIVVDPRGNKTTYDFDDSYRTSKITDDLDGVIEYQYDSNNNLTCVTNQLGKKTGYAYDATGNVTQVIDALNTGASCLLKPGGVSRTYGYTTNNDIDLETDPRGNMTDYGYDPAGNLTSVTRKDSGGTPLATTTLTRDPGGNGDLTAVTDANGHATTYTYDSYGLLDTVDGPLAGPPNDLTDYNFDSGGRLSSVTDAESNATSYQYDAQNNVIQVTDALNQSTSYGYDAKGNRTSVTDAKRQPVGPAETGDQCGASGTGDGGDDDDDTVEDDGCPTTRFAYDDADHLQSVIDALGRVTSYEYDAVGNRSQRTDARGLVTKYLYDAVNRLTDIEHWNGANLVDTVGYTYYADGLRQSMTEPTGTTSYEYFDNHQLKEVTDPQGNVVEYTYDPSGNRETITYPGSPSKTVTYTYDAFDRMETVTDWLGNVTTYNYNDVSNLTSTVYPASTGLTSTRDYDDADHLLALTNTGGSGAISAFSYTLDGVGNRTQVSDNTGVTGYQYDDLYRLTQATYPGPSTTGYTYDAVGNRLTLTAIAGATTYAYDDADQITTVTAPGQPAVNYTWDKNGNLTWRGAVVGVGGIAEAPDVTASASHGGSGLPIAVFAVAGGLAVVVIVVASGAWHGRRRGPIVLLLLALTVPLLAEQEATETHAGPAAAPPAAATFTYDHENRLVASNIGGTASTYTYNGDGLRVSRTVGGTTSSYVWDAGSALPVVLQETTAGQTTYYVYGLDLISSVQGATATYYLTDGLGSTTQLADGAGAVAGEYNYDVFGAVRTHTGASTEWSFTGEQNDPTGLEYLRARYYDPALGRFLSRDPFTGLSVSPLSQNRYAYAWNNPVNLVDAYGYAPWDVVGDVTDKIGECLGDPADCAGDAAEGVVDYVTDPEQIGTGLQFVGMVGMAACPALLGTGAGGLVCAGAAGLSYVGGTLLKWEDIHQEVHRGKCSPAEGKARQILGVLPLPGNPVSKWVARKVLVPVLEGLYSGYAEAAGACEPYGGSKE